jgi:hypothetical protein
MASLIDTPGLFIELSDLVARRGIKNLFESGTGPASSGLEAARRLGLRGYSCDVFEPCVVRAAEVYPEFDVWHGDSEGVLKRILPELEGPTFFWLDGHCPTDSMCLPASVFPLYGEMVLIRDLKRGYEKDVLWIDDASMIIDPANPVATSWDVYLGGPDTRWFGEGEHTWEQYLAVFGATHDWALKGDEKILTLTPKG